MSERYSRVFSLSENLYATDSPIVIEAGALQKDNQTGSILAQIKMKNISAKVIKAVKVKLTLFDVAGNILADGVEHQYLDLKVSRDESFGSKSAIKLKESTTRSFSVNITAVVFEDGSVWSGTANPWETLSQRTDLLNHFKSIELVKQFELTYGSPCHYVLLEEKDLWHCTCGALNKNNEPKCHKCGKSLKALQELDVPALQAAKEKRVEEERIAAEEKAERERKEAERERKEAEMAKIAAEAKKKRTKKIAAIVVPIVCVIVVAVLLVYKMVLVPSKQYNEAIVLVNEEKYEEALIAFEALNEYKDSQNYVELCYNEVQYGKAISLMDEQKYQEAVSIFENLAGYKDSKVKIEFCNQEIKYDKAVVLLDAGIYDKAIEAFSALGDYKDSVSKVKIAETMVEKIQPTYNKRGSVVSFGGYQWTIAQKRGNKVQLITKDPITTMALNKTAVDKSNWKSSDAYKWLNNSFYNSFKSADQKAIIETNGDMVTLLTTSEAINLSTYYTSSGIITPDSEWWLLPEEKTSWPWYLDTDGSVSSSTQVYCNASLGITPVIWIDLVRLAEIECGIK